MHQDEAACREAAAIRGGYVCSNTEVVVGSQIAGKADWVAGK